MNALPTHQLNDGVVLPAIGFGTYPIKDPAPIVSALQNGYRLLDTAVNYENEDVVGAALAGSGVARPEVILTSKVPGRFHAYDLALQSVQDSMKRLRVEQVDLMLIHWPNPSRGLYLQAWRALIEARQRGWVRSIGVSNFTPSLLREISDETGVVPAVNQVELHPYFPQTDLLQVHRDLGIVTEAWSPLGRATESLKEQPVADAAAAHGVSAVQVILRWHLQRGVLPLPKSETPERQRANLDVGGFALSQQEVEAITGLGRADGRLFDADPDTHEEM